jgi:sarcosine oxidase, subunit gamma
MPEPLLRSLPSVASGHWLKARPPASRFILHGGAEARKVAAPIWGADFAEDACRAVVRDGRATLWMGPDEYLLLGTGEQDPEAILRALERALSGVACALVDVSHRQFALEVSGPHAVTILSGGCPLDLDLTTFPIGMCTRTVLAKADIVLWRTGGDTFHLEVWRSFNGYVTGLLSEIAREFYTE